MKGLSDKEIEILLLLVKDIFNNYNSNNITKKIKISSAGAFKAMKNLEKKKLIEGKRMGKATFYKVNLKDYYAFRIIETLLINEAREKASRWLEEFKELNKHAKIVMIYGSIIRDQKNAGDIDLLVISKKEDNKAIDKIMKERRTISARPIHTIRRCTKELDESLKKRDRIILNIIGSCYVLHGYDKLLETIKNVASI
jgi:predicted nucleotidyltransferase